MKFSIRFPQMNCIYAGVIFWVKEKYDFEQYGT